jgi:sugar-specific transcriptional regulator TrmB
MDVEQLTELQELGFTKPEIKVYTTLLELNESKTGKLCFLTKIPNSRIYSILDSLIDKGLVSYKITNKIKVYMPAPPEILKSILDKKHRKILSAVKLLQEKKTKVSNFQYKTFNNVKGIRSMFLEINNVMNKNLVLSYYTSAKGSYERLMGIFNEHHDLKISKKIKSRILISNENKDLGERRKNKYTEVKYISIDSSAEWGVIGDKMLFIFYIMGDDPKGILIEDQVIANTFKKTFEKIWDKTK